MKLQHIIDSVRYGELTNISWDNKNRIPAIISFINQGLTDLYSRFPLMEKQLIIQQYPQISVYRLTRDFARTNFKSEQLHKYILDTPFEPFQEDILQISGVYTEEGIPVPLNDTNNPRSYFLPSYNTIQIPNANENDATFITYKAKHRYISPTTEDLNQEVELPPCLAEALYAYLGYKCLVSMGSTDTVQLAQLYLQRYEQLCTSVNIANTLGNLVVPTNIKAYIQGFK